MFLNTSRITNQAWEQSTSSIKHGNQIPTWIGKAYKL